MAEQLWTKISSRMWLDDRVLAMSGDEFRFFQFAMTNHDRASTGLSRFSLGLASDILGYSYEQCKGYLEGLVEGFGWVYDKESNTLLIPTWLDDVDIDALNNLEGILKSLKATPSTPLIVDWFDALFVRLDGKELNGTGKRKFVATRKNLLDLVVKFSTKCNAMRLKQALAQGVLQDLHQQQRTKNQEPRTENLDSLEDHKCKEGGCGGGALDTEVNADDRPEFGALPAAFRESWSEPFRTEVVDLAKRRFEWIKGLPGYKAKDGTTLLKIAACEACGQIGESFVADACEGLRTARESPSSPVGYLYTILQRAMLERSGRKIEHLLGRVKLPPKNES